MDAPAPRHERHPLAALQRGDALIDHPAASRVDWTPLSGGGPNIHNATLVDGGDGTWSVRPSLQAWAFSLLFAVLGAGALARWMSDAGLGWPVAAAGALFVVVGAVMLLAAPRWWIDPAGGWLRRRARPFRPGRTLRVDEVVALQLLPEWVVAERTRYFSYELNVVLDDGARVGLMEHGAYAALGADAARLASLLGVPLWEAVAERPSGRLDRLLSTPGRDR